MGAAAARHQLPHPRRQDAARRRHLRRRHPGTGRMPFPVARLRFRWGGGIRPSDLLKPRVVGVGVGLLQRGEEFMFDEAKIQRMEQMVLNALEWRTRSVTPLAFLGFFLSACFPQPRHPALLDAIKARAVDLLLRVQPGTSKPPPRPMPPSSPLDSASAHLLPPVHFAEVKMAEFSPSVAAAAALLAAAGEVAGGHFLGFEAGVAACPFVNSVSMILFFLINFVSSKITPLITTYLRNNPCHV